MMHERNDTSGPLVTSSAYDNYDSTLGLEITFGLYNLRFNGCLLLIDHVNRVGGWSFGLLDQ